jgi:transposase-like protein
MLASRTSVRRIEVITETGRRRQFSADDKARFVEETLVPGAVISEVARRHGLSPQQLFTWRRQMRQGVCDACGSRVADVRARCRYPIVHAAGALTAATPTPPEDARGRRGIAASSSSRSTASRSGSAAVRVMVATRPVDFRRGAEKLAALMRESIQADPFSGAVYVFRAKRADLVRLIY